MTRQSDAGEVFQRIQSEFNIEQLDQDTIIDWLKGGLEKSLGYQPATTSGLEQFSREVESLAVTRLSSEIKVASSRSDFDRLDKIKIDRIQDDVRRKRERIEKNLVEEVKTIVSEKEFVSSVRELRRFNPQRLGGIRSGQTRRAQKGFRVLFEEI